MVPGARLTFRQADSSSSRESGCPGLAPSAGHSHRSFQTPRRPVSDSLSKHRKDLRISLLTPDMFNII